MFKLCALNQKSLLLRFGLIQYCLSLFNVEIAIQAVTETTIDQSKALGEINNHRLQYVKFLVAFPEIEVVDRNGPFD